jgi:hypothetical protein
LPKDILVSLQSLTYFLLDVWIGSFKVKVIVSKMKT